MSRKKMTVYLEQPDYRRLEAIGRELGELRLLSFGRRSPNS
jgi:hypothetical protein